MSDRDLIRPVEFWNTCKICPIFVIFCLISTRAHILARVQKKTNKMLGSRLIETLAFSLKVYGGKGNFGVALIFT